MANYAAASTYNNNNLWVANTGASTNERFEGLISTETRLGGRTETYSSFVFESGGLTYEYQGQWQVDASSGLLTTTVSASGTYNTVIVRSGATVVATATGLSFTTNFGSATSLTLLDVLSPVVDPVVALLFGAGLGSASYANLHLDATPDLAARAFAGSDVIAGSGGDDVLNGYAGNDTINGGVGADTMAGDLGDDTYYVDNLGDVVVDTGGNDKVVLLVDGYDQSTLAGIETIVVAEIGSGGNDTLVGGPDEDYIDGDAGNDVVDGGAGDDTLLGGSGNDTISGAAGNDNLDGGDGDDAVSGGLGNDVLEGGAGNDLLDGADGDDVLSGGAGNDILIGGPGNDRLIGGLGDDTYYVDSPGDVVVEDFNAGMDRVFTTVNYTLTANVEDLYATGPVGLSLTGNALSNSIFGNAASNRITGAEGNDQLHGGGGNDRLYGDSGNDKLYGGPGRDYLYGGAGHDFLYSGSEKDVLSGSTGNDTFVFDTQRKTNIDRITDFNPKYDSIWLDNVVFKKLGSGSELAPTKLKKAYFTIGKEAKDSNDYVIYDNKAGRLFYDADGSGSTKAVEITSLQKNLKLTYNDFFVV